MKKYAITNKLLAIKNTGMTLKVYFFKKIGTSKEKYFFELNAKAKTIHGRLKAIMKEFVLHYYQFKMEKGFIEYDSIELFINSQKKETIFPLTASNGLKLNIEYLINFHWEELTEIDMYKIININFPDFIWTVKESKRNSIRNLASINNPYLLSNGQGLVKFEKEIKKIVINQDPHYVKKSRYKTLVKYRK